MNYANITLFNRYIAQHAAFYQRTYLYKVDWGTPTKNIGNPVSFSTQITIPFSQSLYYREPRTWLANKDTYWTLQLEDVIVNGIVDAQIATVTDLYGNYSLTDLKKSFEVVTITSLNLNNTSISQLNFTVGVA